MQLNVRPLEAADLDAWRDLRLSALLAHPEAFGSDYTAQLAQPRDFWLRRLEQVTQGQSQRIFVADSDAGLMGMIGIVRQDDSPKTAHNAEIISVYVRPHARGQRLGDHLLAACHAWGIQVGVEICRLGVAVDNAPALACYRRCGYQLIGVNPKAIRWQGRDIDEYLMFRDLANPSAALEDPVSA